MRYQLILEAFLLGVSSSFRKEIMKQDGQIGMFMSLSKEIKGNCHLLFYHLCVADAKPETRESTFKKEVHRVQFADTITLPIGIS
jgi:hypothetical protein